MHILVINDDGPPSSTSSPYVHPFIRSLEVAGHQVTVCLPNKQRSWIAKAHMIGETVKPTYYRPPKTFDPRPSALEQEQGTTHSRPAKSTDVEEWILLDGTPASCAQIGLHHFLTEEKGPVDLVVSGPNYGRNTTAVFALSSGTLGGALEAAVCKTKAIALSFAFFNRNHDPNIIGQACTLSVKVIQKLYDTWPSDGSVDLYSVNVPLVDGVVDKKVVFTEMLSNYWGGAGACFQEVEGGVGDEDEEESRIREAEGQEAAQHQGQEETRGRFRHRHFKWAPRFADVYKSVEDAGPGNDGWAVKEGYTSVTPLKANFFQAAAHLQGQELKLESNRNLGSDSMGVCGTKPLEHRSKDHFYALIAYGDQYVQPLILDALKKSFAPNSYTLLSLPPRDPHEEEMEVSLRTLLPQGGGKILQITPYEAIDWDYVSINEENCLINSYMLRKALIRKHYLVSTIESWVAKRPESVLKTHVKRSEAFELDYAEFLDDALVETFDLRASLEKNEGKELKEREWWILKPSMSDRGQGIRLFSSMDELQGIFDEWEVESDEEEANDDYSMPAGPETDDAGGENEGLGIMTSQLRHFVAQPYIHPPLLLPGHENRKFHIRTYVLCTGALDVYVYREMLALFAGKPYLAPWEEGGDDLESHLTNTCLQRTTRDGSVHKFWDIELPQTSGSDNGAVSKDGIFEQICAITGELFEAAAMGMMMHFRPLPNAFEVYGLDFLVDEHGTAWLLEVNAFPDFKQTGNELQGLVAELWEGVMRIAVKKKFGESSDQTSSVVGNECGSMVHVRRVDLGRQFGSV